MKWNDWQNSIVYLQVFDGAIIGSRKVFRSSQWRGISNEDVAQSVVLESIRSKTKIVNPSGFGFVGGYRRALDVTRNFNRVASFSELSSESTTEQRTDSKTASPDSRLFLGELMDRICGEEIEEDMFILRGIMEDKTFVEIAGELGMKPSTVRARFYAMKKRAKPYRTDYFLDA